MDLQNNYYILRHGQTIYQRDMKEWAYPKKDSSKVKLTEKGKKQVEKSVLSLKGKGVDLIYSSDFYRTKQTANIAARVLGVKEIKFTKELRDVNIGVYHGRKKEEYYRDFPKFSKECFWKVPFKGESSFQCQKRMLKFLKRIDAKHKNKTILIVSHGDPLWLLEGAVKELSIDKLFMMKKSNYIKVGELRRLYGK